VAEQPLAIRALLQVQISQQLLQQGVVAAEVLVVDNLLEVAVAALVLIVQFLEDVELLDKVILAVLLIQML